MSSSPPVSVPSVVDASSGEKVGDHMARQFVGGDESQASEGKQEHLLDPRRHARWRRTLLQLQVGLDAVVMRVSVLVEITAVRNQRVGLGVLRVNRRAVLAIRRGLEAVALVTVATLSGGAVKGSERRGREDRRRRRVVRRFGRAVARQRVAVLGRRNRDCRHLGFAARDSELEYTGKTRERCDGATKFSGVERTLQGTREKEKVDDGPPSWRNVIRR